MLIASSSFAGNQDFSFMKANFNDNIEKLKEKGFSCSATECNQDSFDLSVLVTFNPETKRPEAIILNEAFKDRNECKAQLKLFSYVINDKFGYNGYNPESNKNNDSGVFLVDGEKISFKTNCEKSQGDTPAMSGFRLVVNFINENAGNNKIDNTAEKLKVYRFFE